MPTRTKGTFMAGTEQDTTDLAMHDSLLENNESGELPMNATDNLKCGSKRCGWSFLWMPIASIVCGALRRCAWQRNPLPWLPPRRPTRPGIGEVWSAWKSARPVRKLGHSDPTDTRYCATSMEARSFAIAWPPRPSIS